MNPAFTNNSRDLTEDRSFYTLIEAETIPDRAKHWQKEHFIPVARADWRVLMTDAAVDAGLSHDQFEQFCTLLDTLVHMRSYHSNAAISEQYSQIDPDNISERLPEGDAASSFDEHARQTVQQLDEIMVRANYQKLNHHDLFEALKNASEFGMPMSADFSVFKRFGVYVRGKVIGQRIRRRLSTFYKREEVEVPLFQRLVICFQLTQEAAENDDHRHDCLYIKSFKNIPQHDIDMLLPGTVVKMSLLDRSKIALPTLSGLVILAFRIFFVVSLGLFAFVSLLCTTGGYAIKSIFGYLRTKDKYQLNLTRNLYYQNLGNNSGVLQQLQNEAEVQEIQECLLGYTMLLLHYPQGATARQLDQVAEKFIENAVAFPVDFEVDDALHKLVHLKLVSVNGARHFVPKSLAQGILTLKDELSAFISACGPSISGQAGQAGRDS